MAQFGCFSGSMVADVSPCPSAAGGGGAGGGKAGKVLSATFPAAPFVVAIVSLRTLAEVVDLAGGRA